MIGHKNFAVLCVLTAACLIAAPCFTRVSHAVEIVIPAQRVLLSQTGSGTGKWQARDISIEFKYNNNQGFELTGSVIFDDSIVYNFDRMPSFHADVIFADEKGRVLSTQGLLSARIDGGVDQWEPIKFSQKLALPPGTASISFSYTGQVTAMSGGKGGGGSDQTNIWYHPVTNVDSVQ